MKRGSETERKERGRNVATISEWISFSVYFFFFNLRPLYASSPFLSRHGSCNVSGICLTSTNYPKRYPDNDNCTIEILENGFLTVADFDTESYFDCLRLRVRDSAGDGNTSFLNSSDSFSWSYSYEKCLPSTYASSYSYNPAVCEDANDHFDYQWEYSGSIVPTASIDVAAGNVIVWKADANIDGTGWKLCFDTTPKPSLVPTITSSPTSWEGRQSQDFKSTCQNFFVDGCMTSGNFPGSYNNKENCKFEVLRNGTLEVESFNTESTFDYVEINEVRYSDVNGPEGVLVAAGEIIRWSSDASITNGGFKICLSQTSAPSISPAPTTRPPTSNPTEFDWRWFLVKNGSCQITGWNRGCISSTNYPDPYPPNDECTIIILKNGTADVVDFETEKDSDFLMWGNMQFSGFDTSRLNGKTISAGEEIKWRASGSSEEQYLGWKICYTSPPTMSPTAACGFGSFLSESGCQVCPKGKYSEADGSAPFPTSCVSCSKGTFSNIEGAPGPHFCTKCMPSYYASSAGLTSCTPCPIGFTSLEGASSCELAANGFFLDPLFKDDDEYLETDPASRGHSKICPSGASCTLLGGAPIPKKGFWSDRTSINYIASIYECFRPNVCKGGDERNECWLLENFIDSDNNYSSGLVSNITTEGCDLGENLLLCEPGNIGPLCGACSKSFVYSASQGKCIACKSRTNMIPLYALGSLAVVIFVVLAYMWLRRERRYQDLNHENQYSESFASTVAANLSWISEIPPFSILRYLDRGDIKVLYGTFSIIGSVSWSLNLRFPAPFDGFSSFLSILQFNFVSLDCMSPMTGAKLYFTGIITTTLVPFAIGIFAMAIYGSRLALGQRRVNEVIHRLTMPVVLSSPLQQQFYERELLSKERNISSIHQDFWSQLLLLAYIALPPISSSLLSAFDCITHSYKGTNDSIHFLRANTIVDCESSQYRTFLIFVTAFVIVYLAIPFYFYYLVYTIRSTVDPDLKRYNHTFSASNNLRKAADATLDEDQDIDDHSTFSKGALDLFAKQDAKDRYIRGRKAAGGLGCGGSIRNQDQNKEVERLQKIKLREELRCDCVVKFLWQDYAPEWYSFEVIDLLRRIIFVGVLPLLGSRSLRACLGFFLSFIFAIFIREAEPFLRPSTNLLATVAAHQVTITFFGAIIIENGSLSRLGLSDLALGCILLAVNVATLLIAGWWCFRRHLEELTKRHWRHAISDNELDLLKKIMNGEETKQQTPQTQLPTRREEHSTTEEDPSKITSLEQIQKEYLSVSSEIISEEGQTFAGQHISLNQKVIAQYALSPSEIVLNEKIGAGSFGEVFQGTARGEPVAIKTMITVDEVNIRCFKAEIILTATLQSPFIVNFIGCCWGKELTCLVLEWVDNGSLADLLDDFEKELFWNDPLLRIATQITQGMEYLHNRTYLDEEDGCMKKCILHRDLKPDNVLVTSFLSVKITDFGTSRAKDINDKAIMSAVGTPLFCCPEMMRGEFYDEKADIYSFGITLINMAVDEPLIDFLSGRFMSSFKKKRAPTTMKLIRKMTDDGWRPLGDEVAGNGSDISFAPRTINALIRRCCDHDQTKRPSFKDILEYLKGPAIDEIISGTINSVPFSRRSSQESTKDIGEDKVLASVDKRPSFGRSETSGVASLKRRTAAAKRATHFPTGLQPAKLDDIVDGIRKGAVTFEQSAKQADAEPDAKEPRRGLRATLSMVETRDAEKGDEEPRREISPAKSMVEMMRVPSSMPGISFSSSFVFDDWSISSAKKAPQGVEI